MDQEEAPSFISELTETVESAAAPVAAAAPATSEATQPHASDDADGATGVIPDAMKALQLFGHYADGGDSEPADNVVDNDVDNTVDMPTDDHAEATTEVFTREGKPKIDISRIRKKRSSKPGEAKEQAEARLAVAKTRRAAMTR
jgi:hypothetical protein